jgi:hypothetical protein
MDDAHDAEPEASPYVRLPWKPLAATLLGVLLLALAAGLFANRYLRPQVSVVPTPIPAAAQISTPAALASPLPSATLTPVPSVAPTVVPSPPAHAPATISPTPPPFSPALRPPVEPEVVEEVSQAYERYWQVRAEALLNLDRSRLHEVMDNPHLQSAKISLVS